MTKTQRREIEKKVAYVPQLVAPCIANKNTREFTPRLAILRGTTPLLHKFCSSKWLLPETASTASKASTADKKFLCKWIYTSTEYLNYART